jgi:hypothetical protein
VVVGLFQLDDRTPERIGDSIRTLKRIMIPETKDTEPCLFETPIAHSIPLIIRMLTAVDFDHKPDIEANEIQNEAFVRMLAPEFAAFDLTIAQNRPNTPLGIGHIGAEAALQFGFEDSLIRLSFHGRSVIPFDIGFEACPALAMQTHPHPNPPPEGEGIETGLSRRPEREGIEIGLSRRPEGEGIETGLSRCPEREGIEAISFPPPQGEG